MTTPTIRAALANLQPMPLPSPSPTPAYGVLIACTIEDSWREGATVWIDLLEVEDSDHIQYLIDTLTGRAAEPYPDGWNEEGTFEVREVRGLGPRLSALASDTEGPMIDTLADLAEAIQNLPPDQVGPFLTWAEGFDGEWWQPGYGIHPPEDAVLLFSCTAASAPQPVTERLSP